MPEKGPAVNPPILVLAQSEIDTIYSNRMFIFNLNEEIEQMMDADNVTSSHLMKNPVPSHLTGNINLTESLMCSCILL